VGISAAMYATDFGDHIPICFKNIEPTKPWPWKSWRANLLDYCNGYATFNCPASVEDGAGTTVFHSKEEVASLDHAGTANAGSYSVLYQFSLPSYKATTSIGSIDQGHPVWSNSYSTAPGVAWRHPADSVYAADACFTQGPITYPSVDYKGWGTSYIIPPSSPRYFTDIDKVRRFADRHEGTNCVFVDGHVGSYYTRELDAMKAGESDCVWDVE